MDMTFSAADEAFRAEVREFLEVAFDKELRQASRQTRNHYLPKDLQQRWHDRLYEKGWVAPNWPVEWGGSGWSATQEYIYEQEITGAGAPRLSPYGIRMCAPVLLKYGTKAQQDFYLPRILSGQDWWCQGYSEPGAGSDLAALQLKAERQDNHYLLNGSKIWTSEAQHADMIFCLVRTGWHDKRQDGISFVLVDMRSPGITVEPIMTLDLPQLGYHEVNQVFFDDVKIPVENRIGKEGKGWTYAKYLLEFERGETYSGLLWASLKKAKEMAETESNSGDRLLDEPIFARKLAAVATQISAMEVTELRILSRLSNGQNMGPESSLMKCRGSELQLSLSELMLQAVGYYAAPFQPLIFGDTKTHVGPQDNSAIAPAYFNERKVAIYSGSNEIQRNIMAKAILGL